MKAISSIQAVKNPLQINPFKQLNYLSRYSNHKFRKISHYSFEGNKSNLQKNKNKYKQSRYKRYKQLIQKKIQIINEQNVVNWNFKSHILIQDEEQNTNHYNYGNLNKNIGQNISEIKSQSSNQNLNQSQNTNHCHGQSNLLINMIDKNPIKVQSPKNNNSNQDRYSTFKINKVQIKPIKQFYQHSPSIQQSITISEPSQIEHQYFFNQQYQLSPQLSLPINQKMQQLQYFDYYQKQIQNVELVQTSNNNILLHEQQKDQIKNSQSSLDVVQDKIMKRIYTFGGPQLTIQNSILHYQQGEKQVTLHKQHIQATQYPRVGSLFKDQLILSNKTSKLKKQPFKRYIKKLVKIENNQDNKNDNKLNEQLEKKNSLYEQQIEYKQVHSEYDVSLNYINDTEYKQQKQINEFPQNDNDNKITQQSQKNNQQFLQDHKNPQQNEQILKLKNKQHNFNTIGQRQDNKLIGFSNLNNHSYHAYKTPLDSEIQQTNDLSQIHAKVLTSNRNRKWEQIMSKLLYLLPYLPEEVQYTYTIIYHKLVQDNLKMIKNQHQKYSLIKLLSLLLMILKRKINIFQYLTQLKNIKNIHEQIILTNQIIIVAFIRKLIS